jgi:LysM repeat protein
MAPLPKASDAKVETNATVLSKDSSQVTTTQPKKEQSSQPVSAGLSPIFHTVKKKETLYQISQQYNKVPIADIKSWNHLKEDGVKEGMKLIVGYATKPSVKEQAPTSDSVKSITKTIVANKVTVATPPKKTEPAPAESKNMAVKNATAGGFFASAFSLSTEANALNESGLAGVFKSTSGWDDKKFYCLYNNTTAGTIVKITNSDNQKFIYAKVLDMMPDLKQNKDFIIRISNAAAQELGANSDSFNVSILR